MIINMEFYSNNFKHLFYMSIIPDWIIKAFNLRGIRIYDDKINSE